MFFLKKRKLVALFSYRFDESLIPDLLKNIEGFVDDYIVHNDSTNENKWYHEGEIRNNLIQKAREKKANWVICIDPDERFEHGAGEKIRQAIRTNDKVIYRFPFRELWTPDKYRVDGIWGAKGKEILFPLLKDQQFMNLPVHSQWAPINPEYRRETLNVNLYHLKMINPANRIKRRDMYNDLDPEKKIQTIGYDYLADESNIKLQDIPEGRGYTPEYQNYYNTVDFYQERSSGK